MTKNIGHVIFCCDYLEPLRLLNAQKMKKDTDLNKIKHFHIDTSTCNILNSSHKIKTFYCENVKKKTSFGPYVGCRSAFFFFFEKIVWFGSKTMFKRIRERWEGSKEKKLETGEFL